MEFIKENLITVVLLTLIIAILVVLGIFVYKIVTQDNNSDQIAIEEIKEIIPNDNVNENNKIEEQVYDETSSPTNFNTQKNNTTLIQIANIFNSSNAAENMRLQGYTLNAIALENGIAVSSSGDGLSFNIQFYNNNDILSTEIIYNQTDSRINVIELMLAVILVDSIGQMKGYPEQTLSTALEDEKAINYTLENQGVEIKQLDNGQGIGVRVDLNSNFSFLNI